MNNKICFKCNSEKSFSEFYVHPRMHDGHLNKCKECTKKDSTKHRWDNIEKVRNYDRNRPKSERVKIRNRLYSKYWTSKNKEKRKAHGIFMRALKKGIIFKAEKCIVCGSNGKLEAHHEDYNKPLDVLWLCISCHRCLHRDLKKSLTAHF